MKIVWTHRLLWATYRASVNSPLRLSLLCISLLVGCESTRKPIPSFRPITGITIVMHDVQDLNLPKSDPVSVPNGELANFSILITPTKNTPINPKLNYHIADAILQHDDLSTTNLIIRWTGHNPAAVSIDGVNYYYAGYDSPFPDGGIRISRLISGYAHGDTIDREKNRP